MATSRIRAVFDTVGAAKVSGDFRLVNDSAKLLNGTLKRLSSLNAGSFSGLEAAGKAASRAAVGFGELRKAVTNFPSTKTLIDNLAKLGAVDTSGLQRAAGATRGLTRALSALGPAAAGAASAAASLNALAAVSPGGMAATATAIRSLTRALKAINGAGIGLAALSTQLSALGAIPLGNLANLGRALREMGKGVRDLAAAAPSLAPLAAGLKTLADQLSSRRLQRGLASFAGLSAGLTDLSRALQRMGNSAAGIASLAGALASLAGALNTASIRDAIRDFTALGPALGVVAKALASLARSSNNFSNMNALAMGIDRVNQSLRSLAITSNDANLQRLLQNLRDIRAAPGGGGGGGGNAGAGGRRASAGSRATALVTTPFKYAAGAASLAFRGISEAGSIGAKGVSLITGATQSVIKGMISLGQFGFRTLEGITKRALDAAKTVAKIGVGAALGTGALGIGIKKAFEDDNTLAGIESTLKVVTGSAEAASAKIREIAPAIDAMGFSFEGLAPTFAKFSAAAIGTSLAGQQVEDVFFAVANAGRALSLSTEDQKGILLALQQTISKGTLQAEELRSQVAERLPGAFNIAARAMGVTREELDKLIQSGKVSATDFLPKFAAQLNKEFGAAAGSADRPVAAFERLKNSIFSLFTAIGRAGVTQSVVKILNMVSQSIRDLVSSGNATRFGIALSARLNSLGRSAARVGQTIRDAYAIMQRPGINGRLIASAPSNPFGPLTDPQYIALFGRNRRAVARGYADLFNLIIAFGQLVGKAFRDAFSVPNASAGVTFLQGLNYVLTFIGRTALPLALRGFKALFRIMAGGVQFAREFFAALSQTDFVDQIKLSLNSIGSLFRSLGNGLGLAGRQVEGSTAAQKLASGFATAAYVVGIAIDKVVTVLAYLEAFLIRLGRNGTFARMGKDAKDFLGSLLGVSNSLTNKDLSTAPDALADAFGSAYTRISDGLRKVFGELRQFFNAFKVGFQFEGKAREALERDAASGNPIAKKKLAAGDTTDIDLPGEDADTATLGQTIARLANALGNAFGPLATLAVGYANALATAATWLLKMLDGLRNLVGDEAFGKLSGLVAGLLLLNKIGGFSILAGGGGVGGLFGGIIGSLLGGMGALFAGFISTLAATLAGGVVTGTTAAVAGKVGATLALPAIFATSLLAYIGKLNDTQGSRDAQRDAANANSLTELAGAILRGAGSAFDSDGKLGEMIQQGRFAKQFGLGVYEEGSDGRSDRSKSLVGREQYERQRAQQQALAAQQARQAEIAQATGTTGAGKDLGTLTLVNPKGDKLYVTADGREATNWSSFDSVQRAQQGQNGAQSSAFFGGS